MKRSLCCTFLCVHNNELVHSAIHLLDEKGDMKKDDAEAEKPKKKG